MIFGNKKLGWNMLLTGVVLIAGSVVMAKVYPFWLRPCAQPIQYSIGTFDSKFRVSQADFLADIAAAEKIWETPAQRNLFEYVPNTASLKVNLIYDDRQQATDRLKSLGYTIENTKASYDRLKARYDSLTASYGQNKANLDSEVVDFNNRKSAYEKSVDQWNRQGGAPHQVADQLNAQYKSLLAEANQINRDKDALNTQVADINSLVGILNSLGVQLNLNVSNYNTIGQSRGEEFEEGAFVQDATGHHVDIYEFSNYDQLIRLLAHEMRHSLGLQHVDDANAIMYRLNESQNHTATPADLTELNRVCHISS